MAAEFTPPERHVDETDQQYLARVRRARALFDRASRGPASSLKYGARTDREAEKRGDRPLPGFTVPGHKGELFIPPAQKYSIVKREVEQLRRMTYDQIVDYYRSHGDSESVAKRKAGETLDQYARDVQLTRDDLDAMAARTGKGRGVVVRKGTGERARKGSEVAKEYAAKVRELQRLERGDDQQGRGLPRILTSTGPSVFTDERGSFDPGRQGTSLRPAKVQMDVGTRAQAKAIRDAYREERARQRAERQSGEGFYRSGTSVPGAPRLTPEERRAVQEATEREAMEQQERIQKFVEEYEEKTGTKISDRDEVVDTPQGVRIIRGGRRTMSGLGAFDRTTQFLTAVTVLAIGAGAFLVYRAIQEKKEK